MQNKFVIWSNRWSIYWKIYALFLSENKKLKKIKKSIDKILYNVYNKKRAREQSEKINAGVVQW